MGASNKSARRRSWGTRRGVARAMRLYEAAAAEALGDASLADAPGRAAAVRWEIVALWGHPRTEARCVITSPEGPEENAKYQIPNILRPGVSTSEACACPRTSVQVYHANKRREGQRARARCGYEGGFGGSSPFEAAASSTARAAYASAFAVSVCTGSSNAATTPHTHTHHHLHHHLHLHRAHSLGSFPPPFDARQRGYGRPTPRRAHTRTLTHTRVTLTRGSGRSINQTRCRARGNQT